jgi:hypothetical protein
MGRKRFNTSNINLDTILSMFSFHNLVVCKSEDQGIYCNIMKILNLIIAFIFIGAIFYFIYALFIKQTVKKRR